MFDNNVRNPFVVEGVEGLDGSNVELVEVVVQESSGERRVLVRPSAPPHASNLVRWSASLSSRIVVWGIPMKDYITGVTIIEETNNEFTAKRSGSWPDLFDC